MRELPIIFNTEMVKSILRGDKVCTRRPINPQPVNMPYGSYIDPYNKNQEHFTAWGADHKMLLNCGGNIKNTAHWKPPYQTGDLLYVRETWQRLHDEFGYINIYRADDPEIDGIKWIPSIHMPKKHARIWLKVTGIRVERVQDITVDDLDKEGLQEMFEDEDSIVYKHFSRAEHAKIGGVPMKHIPEIYGFVGLWDSIYKNWNDNPWVWVIDFEVIKK